MAPASQTTQQLFGMGAIARLSQDFAVQDDRGVGTEHRQPATIGLETGPRLGTGDTAHVAGRRLVLEHGLVDVDRHHPVAHANLVQQFAPAG